MSLIIGEVTKAKCPQCGARALYIHELIEVTDSYIVKDGVVIDRETHTSVRGTLRYKGECLECEHTWQFRREPNSAPAEDSSSGVPEHAAEKR